MSPSEPTKLLWNSICKGNWIVYANGKAAIKTKFYYKNYSYENTLTRIKIFIHHKTIYLFISSFIYSHNNMIGLFFKFFFPFYN